MKIKNQTCKDLNNNIIKDESGKVDIMLFESIRRALTFPRKEQTTQSAYDNCCIASKFVEVEEVELSSEEIVKIKPLLDIYHPEMIYYIANVLEGK